MLVRDQFFLMEYIVTADAEREPEIIVRSPLELLINFGDRIQLESEGRTILLPGSQFLLLPEDNAFRVKSASGLQYLYLKISPDFREMQSLHTLPGIITALSRRQSGNMISECGLQYISDLADKMIREFQADSQAYAAFRYSWLSEILLNLFQNPSSGGPEKSENGVIPEITRFLELNFLNKISVDMLASRFYISKYHLMRQFKKETGYTIHNFILNKRVRHACHLIEKDVPPSEACYLSGFTDYSLFFKAFTKITGSAPSRYHFTPPVESAGTGA